MSFDDNAQKRYQLLEWIDALAGKDGRVMLQVGAPDVKDLDPNMIGIWLDDLEEKELLKVVERPEFPIVPGLIGKTKNDWFVFNVKNPDFHEYVDKVYRWLQLSIDKLSINNFLAVLDAAYELRQRLEVTQANTVDIGQQPNTKKFPQLKDDYINYREQALQFLQEYGAIQKLEDDGFAFYHVTVTRRFFDRTYQNIMTRAVQEGYATYKNDKAVTKTIAEESKRRQEASNAPENRPATSSETSHAPSDKIKFDAKTSTLILGSKTCDIPDETLEHYICKFTFKNRNVAALEDDILEKSVKSQNSQRAVYDAMLRVNKKAKADLGIEKLLVYKAAKLRINKKYQ